MDTNDSIKVRIYNENKARYPSNELVIDKSSRGRGCKKKYIRFKVLSTKDSQISKFSNTSSRQNAINVMVAQMSCSV